MATSGWRQDNRLFNVQVHCHGDQTFGCFMSMYTVMDKRHSVVLFPRTLIRRPGNRLFRSREHKHDLSCIATWKGSQTWPWLYSHLRSGTLRPGLTSRQTGDGLLAPCLLEATRHLAIQLLVGEIKNILRENSQSGPWEFNGLGAHKEFNLTMVAGNIWCALALIIANRPTNQSINEINNQVQFN